MDKKTLITALIALITLQTAYAYDISYHISDYNTIQPVENVQIDAYNQTEELLNITDAYGNAGLTSSTAADFIITLSRVGYETRQIRRNITSDTQEDLFINPQSTAGIIRLYFNDQTFSSHVNCLYFTDNGRLVTPDGCFRINDTGYQTIHTSINYTIRASTTHLDQISSPAGIKDFLYQNIWLIIGGFFLLCLLGGLVGVALGMIIGGILLMIRRIR